ncbi:RES family NAD+ phosphorylase [Agaricicola taiwanensis]|uniref:RES family NAD+ phosphorylase n=1 Tax=Agaricicola taiwanensis TaxID=591372 RepID=UPI001E4DFD49|nr:RES family NAD+ phosphorylase [Agaricicola taiwanensis]
MTPPLRRVTWRQTWRIIRSIYPPIDLFEDIADPADWEAVASAEAKFNPRVRDAVGDLVKLPVARRVTGPGASWVNAPFVHCSMLRPSRFSDGSFGVYYAADREETALAETIHHHSRMMRATAEAPGWTSEFRALIGSIDRDLHDVADMPGVLDPDRYEASQQLGADLRRVGSDGVTWPSVRHREGRCIGVFWPDVITIPAQGSHFAYHWDGGRVDFIKRLDTGEVLKVS